MRYLRKSTESEIIKQGWQYAKQPSQIRDELRKEQQNFCAYTEKYIDPIDSCDIEHFDDRKKNTDDDSYWNWYAVLHWINQRKRRIKNFLPILLPYDATLSERVHYIDGLFRAVHADDIEAIHLIDFLGWNDPILVEERINTVERIKEIRAFHNGDDAAFLAFIKARPKFLSFISVLEVELGLPLR